MSLQATHYGVSPPEAGNGLCGHCVPSAPVATPPRAADLYDMPAEVDFSTGVRGKFYNPQARFHLPVYLDEAVLAVLVAAAERQGIDVSELANEMLKRDIENAQALR